MPSRDTSEKLTTVAVGGKGAGLVLTGSYGVAMHYVRQPLNFDYGVDIPDSITVVEKELYREMVLRWHGPNGDEELRFWAHVDAIKDEFALMKELAANYRPVFQDNTKK